MSVQHLSEERKKCRESRPCQRTCSAILDLRQLTLYSMEDGSRQGPEYFLPCRREKKKILAQLVSREGKSKKGKIDRFSVKIILSTCSKRRALFLPTGLGKQVFIYISLPPTSQKTLVEIRRPQNIMRMALCKKKQML